VRVHHVPLLVSDPPLAPQRDRCETPGAALDAEGQAALPPVPVVRRACAAGQATAEYALVLLGAAAVALMLTAWATKSGAIGELFDAVVEQLRAKAG
jgi:hypothetical protein